MEIFKWWWFTPLYNLVYWYEKTNLILKNPNQLFITRFKYQMSRYSVFAFDFLVFFIIGIIVKICKTQIPMLEEWKILLLTSIIYVGFIMGLKNNFITFLIVRHYTNITMNEQDLLNNSKDLKWYHFIPFVNFFAFNSFIIPFCITIGDSKIKATTKNHFFKFLKRKWSYFWIENITFQISFSTFFFLYILIFFINNLIALIVIFILILIISYLLFGYQWYKYQKMIKKINETNFKNK